MKLVLGSDFPNVPPKGEPCCSLRVLTTAVTYLSYDSVHSLIAAFLTLSSRRPRDPAVKYRADCKLRFSVCRLLPHKNFPSQCL